MSVTRRVTITFCGIVLLAQLLVAPGCARQAPEPPTQQDRFDSLTQQGDAAWNADDPERAFEMYTEALQTEGAVDPSGKVKAKQDTAKRLMLSRRILATQEPSLGAIGPYVQVLEYCSADSSEAASAREKLAECLASYPTAMRKEVSAMRSAIKAGGGVSFPQTAKLVAGLAGEWQSTVSQAPGATGRHAAAASKQMQAAADMILAAFDEKYAEDALTKLTAAERHISAAERELKASRGEQ